MHHYRPEIDNKFSNLKYQYAKENGLLGKSLVETEKPSNPSKVGAFTSDIEMVELQHGEEHISDTVGVEHSQIRYRGSTNYFFKTWRSCWKRLPLLLQCSLIIEFIFLCFSLTSL
ncbi:hypothetical protein ACTFIW_012553 [Dictyostelium discoideum]